MENGSYAIGDQNHKITKKNEDSKEIRQNRGII